MRELSDEELEEKMISFAAGSPSVLVRIKESEDEVLDVLNLKEKEILILAAAGFDNHEIADQLDYKNNKIVATRIKQIEQKVKNALDINDLRAR